ncbi:hypothetical protein C2S51_021110 [Perilla frutescens var. frutescens]|nr:hypothetical protein C2S51_021110 [Perilla frutescens var. frutescens]
MMMNMREKRHLNRPPPMYKPPNMYLSVVLHYSGKFILSPIAKYVEEGGIETGAGECDVDYDVVIDEVLEESAPKLQSQNKDRSLGSIFIPVQKPPEQWSRSHFTENSKCDMLLNNVCEVFNATILDAREMTIFTMLEWIREWLMVRFQKNREIASLKWKWRICPRIKKLLEMNAEKVHECIPIKGNNTHYEIKCANGDQDDYVHDFLTVETFKKSYAATIRGVNGAVLWGESMYIPPLPPQMIKGKGKQANARRKASDEKAEKLHKNKTKLRRKQSTIRCNGWGGEGHNSVTCGRNKVM